MPADRSLADGAGDDLVGLYRALKLAVLTGMARAFRRSLTGSPPPTALVRRLLELLDARLDEVAHKAVISAQIAGQDEAEREIKALPRTPNPGLVVARPPRIEPATADLTAALRSTHPRVMRWASDAHRDVTLAAAEAPGGTRLQVTQRLWSGLVREGITGFRDESGRRWEIESYTEMAARSRLAETATAAHLDRLADVGIDLVVVSDAAGECKLCRPWEGTVLARDGVGGPRWSRWSMRPRTA